MFGIKIKFEKSAERRAENEVVEKNIKEIPTEEFLGDPKAGQVWEKISKWALYALILFTPLFFLPWGISPVASNKQFLALALVLIAFISWLAKSIASGRLIWAKTLLNAAVVVLLAVWALSSVFSVSKFKSLGFTGLEPDSLVNILVYVLAFFLIGANLRTKEGKQKGILFLFASLAVVAIFTALKFSGANIIPLDFAKAIEFNTIGEIGSLALFLGFGLTMIIGLEAADQTRILDATADQNADQKESRGLWKLGYWGKKAFRPALIVLAIIIAAELLLINFKIGWWALGGVMLFLIAYGFTREAHAVKRGEKKALQMQKLALPIIVLIFSVVLILANSFLANGLPSNKLVSLPVEFSLSNTATFGIAKNIINKSGGLIMGSGPATFTYDYGLYRPADINQSIFWGVRFPQGSSFFLTSLAATGVLGVLSLLFLFFSFGWQAVKKWGNKPDGEAKEEDGFRVAILCGALFLLVSWFLYSANFVLLMTAFVSLGLLAAGRAKPSFAKVSEGRHGERAGEIERNISLLSSPQRTLLISLVLIIMMVGAVSLLYLESQRYIASIYFSSGMADYNNNKDIDSAISKINKAVSLDASSDQYVRAASQAYLVKTNDVLNSPKWQGANSVAADDLRSQFQNNMAQAVDYAKRAADLEPNESANWTNLGFVYENILSFVNGAEKFMTEAYAKAVFYEPKNPAMQSDLGRARLLTADKLAAQIDQIANGKDPDKAQMDALSEQKNSELAIAVAELQKAVELKNDYSPAHFLLVQVYSRQGDLKRAIDRSIDYYSLNPKDPGAAFQLGFLYYKDNQMDNAKAALSFAAELSPDYSNARYFLGLIYDSQGNKAAAKEQFEKIAALNPDNEEVKKILENLNAGRGAMETIVPPATPPQNRTQTPVPETGGAQGEGLQ